MRIAIVAPLIESVPPCMYGGTERVVSVLTEELVGRGHDVTLFASADSKTSASLVPCGALSSRSHGDGLLPTVSSMLELTQVYGRWQDFDVIHNHVDWFAFPFARLTSAPTISTTHGRLDLPEIRNTFERFPEQRLVSISRSQREYLPKATWLGTVYNGIAASGFRFEPNPGSYLVFLGRLSPEKRPDRAIEIAGRAGMKLVIAAKVDPADKDYYDDYISPLIKSSPWAEYVGEVGDQEKDEILGGAFAYLFPIDWPEPFGLTMVEAMAAGTPVIATRCGSVPEIVIEGKTGFICDSVDEMVTAVERIETLDRADCRAHVERHFSASSMADGYEAMYRRLLSAQADAASQVKVANPAHLATAADPRSAAPTLMTGD